MCKVKEVNTQLTEQRVLREIAVVKQPEITCGITHLIVSDYVKQYDATAS